MAASGEFQLAAFTPPHRPQIHAPRPEPAPTIHPPRTAHASRPGHGGIQRRLRPLKLTVGLRPDLGVLEGPPVAVADILHVVGQLRAHLNSDPAGVTLNAAADLLEHIAGTWDQQDDQTRQRAYVLALSL
ncbi:hypothetical protein [Streptomyces sp. RKAG337]|uniref:hypothetical protein n=1 Tax=Streptomyces sp. RKAG337 TaxID=2893404 RepID=UPI0020332D21|nr:hypothetical protein [Streptomyces sp. RKAG337]MCM2425102.1 hypothetical protein [Streptomyces sp. RKAG337]